MDQDIAKKWVAALRSGKYKQGKGALRYEDKYCCWGVLCDIVDPKAWKNGTVYQMYGSSLMPPERIAEAVGITPAALHDFVNNENSLSELNDNGMDFDSIADLIEKHYVNS